MPHDTNQTLLPCRHCDKHLRACKLSLSSTGNYKADATEKEDSVCEGEPPVSVFIEGCMSGWYLSVEGNAPLDLPLHLYISLSIIYIYIYIYIYMYIYIYIYIHVTQHRERMLQGGLSYALQFVCVCASVTKRGIW